MEVQKGIVVAMACMGLLAGSAGTVRAQGVAGSFAELQGKIKANRTVVITDGSGRIVKGKFVDLSPTSLTLMEGHDRRTFEEGKVLQVTELRRQPGKRALQGLGIGALVGTVAVLVSCGDCGEYSGMFTLAGAGIGAAFGAPIGAAVGASQRHERVLFRAPVQPATRTFIVTPFGSKQGTGVRVAVRF